MTVITSSDVNTWAEFNLSPRQLHDRTNGIDKLIHVATINGEEVAWTYRFGNTSKIYRIRPYGFNCEIIDFAGTD